MYRSGIKIGRGRALHDHGPDPEEYFEQTNGDVGSPEKRLRLAVLSNAIASLQRGRAHPAAHEAARWVRGELEAIHVSFSFEAICETLDIDAANLARALLAVVDCAEGDGAKLPRRQVRTQRLRGEPRRYRGRSSARERN